MTIARAAALALAALLALAGCSKESDSVKIGAVLSVTGPASFLGEPEKNTLLMLQDEINAKGGVEGRKLEIVVYDDESDVNKCVMAARKLLDQDKVVAVLGPSISGNTLAIMKLFGPAKTPLVSCSASEKIISPVDPWVFNTPQLDRHAVLRILQDAKKKGYAKIAILTVSDGYGQSGRAVLQELTPAQGLTLVADEVFGPKDTDMTAQLTKIKAAAPDAIICWGTNPGPAVVARNRVQLGIDTPLYMSHGVASKKFIELAGDAAEGIVLPAGRLIVAGQLPDDNPQKALLVGYAEQYAKRFNAPVSTFGGHGWDALMLTVNAIRAGKSAKPQDIRDNLEKTSGFPGTAGIYTYSPTNHNGLDENAFVMVVISKGDWKIAE
ncbi:ABC transporter substrate-binding protein [Desulfovibrio aminophilus]|uniref:ABC transporter substrate-binding protein n=1 Tax=Desulfovibrio aminophilus TaxID=81425 RepID=UPI00040F5C81|nr:ABC transporter substrate-binding protein [Desulfovibrio aminophilus]